MTKPKGLNAGLSPSSSLSEAFTITLFLRLAVLHLTAVPMLNCDDSGDVDEAETPRGGGGEGRERREKGIVDLEGIRIQSTPLTALKGYTV